MESVSAILKVIHIVAVVFMSAPLYALVIVNERALLGPKLIYAVDRYMETMIRKNAVRCYIFQLTAFASGIALILLSGQGIAALHSNWVLGAKMALLLSLMILLSVVHFGIQPRIERHLSTVQGDPVPEEVAAAIRPWRLRRKRLAATCLFLVLVTVILGLQAYSHYPVPVTTGLILLAALFAWRVFKTPIRFGWF